MQGLCFEIQIPENARESLRARRRISLFANPNDHVVEHRTGRRTLTIWKVRPMPARRPGRAKTLNPVLVENDFA